MFTMTTSESLEKLYHLFAKLEDHKKARELVTTIVELAIYDIHEEGHVFSAELFDQKVISHVNDYLEVAEALKIA